MNEKVISANGDYELLDESFQKGNEAEATVVLVIENSASAVLIFGRASKAGTFVAFPDGAIADGKLLTHGKGVTLMVRVSGIAANTVTVGYNYLGTQV